MSDIKIWVSDDECYDADVVYVFRKLNKSFPMNDDSTRTITHVMKLKNGYESHPNRVNESIFLDSEQAAVVRNALKLLEISEE